MKHDLTLEACLSTLGSSTAKKLNLNITYIFQRGLALKSLNIVWFVLLLFSSQCTKTERLLSTVFTVVRTLDSERNPNGRSMRALNIKCTNELLDNNVTEDNQYNMQGIPFYRITLNILVSFPSSSYMNLSLSRWAHERCSTVFHILQAVVKRTSKC